MKFSFRSRVAVYFMISTAFFTGIVLLGIYGVVYKTVYDHLDDDLTQESNEIVNNILILNEKIIFTNEGEWTEREHKQIEMNPTFMQVCDISANIVRKSPNLKDTVLWISNDFNNPVFFNSILSGTPVRQFQIPIKNDMGKTEYALVIALPLKDTISFLRNLAFIMLFSYPLILIPLFFISRLIAGKSISPVLTLKNTAEKITRSNLKERIVLPLHQDELYALINTINNLLDRLEESIEKEHQFTADASHELRTPLSIMKGTLEVLVRKPREINEYEDNIMMVISEIDRISELVDQLLYLARLDNSLTNFEVTDIDINKVIEATLLRLSEKIEEKELQIKFDFRENFKVKANQNMVEIMIENLISNAVKYSPKHKTISIELLSEKYLKIFRVTDQGQGISAEEIQRIFERFYRSDTSRTSKIPGYGLGLSIVKKLADIQNLKLEVSSRSEQGTEFSIIYPA